MKKLLLILAISASAVMADVSSKDDLLNVATAGKSTGTQFEMSKEDMQKAEGGYYSSYITYTNPSSSYYRGTSSSYIYARAFLGR
ncbi:MAG: hypothetical protein WC279_10275 [Sulfurimonas sp.]|jgi:hypothetical protein|uniref:hypothetical protein n=1 Tax=Sulfurimonas sp. TaxID=2022749 RepID=UPI003569A8A6